MSPSSIFGDLKRPPWPRLGGYPGQRETQRRVKVVTSTRASQEIYEDSQEEVHLLVISWARETAFFSSSSMVLRGCIPSVPSVTASTGPKSQVRLRQKDGLAVALKDSRKISTSSSDNAFPKTPFPSRGSPRDGERAEDPLPVAAPSTTAQDPEVPENHPLMPRQTIVTSSRPAEVQETEDPWVVTCDRGSKQCELHVGSEPDVTMSVTVSHLTPPNGQGSSSTLAPEPDNASDLRSFQEGDSNTVTPGAFPIPKLRPIQTRSPPNTGTAPMGPSGTQPEVPLLTNTAHSVSTQFSPPMYGVQLSEDVLNSALQPSPAAKQASPGNVNIWTPSRRAATPESQATRALPVLPDNRAPSSQAETLASAQDPSVPGDSLISGASRGSGSEHGMSPGLDSPDKSWLPFSQRQAQESREGAGHLKQQKQEQEQDQESRGRAGPLEHQKQEQGEQEFEGMQVGAEQSEECSLSITVPRFVEVVIEVPKGSFVKRRPDGSVDYVGFLPCPFNYGSVPAFDALDGDPQDALVLGPRMRQGHTHRSRVEALLRFMDAGMVDHKLVCSQNAPSPVGSSSSSSSPPRTPSRRTFPRCPSRVGPSSPPWGSPCSSSEGSHFSPSRSPPGSPQASTPASPSRAREGGLQGFGLLLSSQWWAGDGGPNPFVLARERRAPACLSQCPGRHGSGIALPVARVRASVKCAVCGGKMPFPGPVEEQQPRTQQHETGFIVPPDSTAHVSPRALGVSSAQEVELVLLNVSLPQFIMLTGFFRFYATCKTVLNRLRGHRGITRFGGWEVPSGSSNLGGLVSTS